MRSGAQQPSGESGKPGPPPHLVQLLQSLKAQFPDPRRPVLTELARAMVPLLDVLLSCWDLDLAALEKVRQQYPNLGNELAELNSWMSGESEPLSPNEAGDWLVRKGFSYSHAERILDRAEQNKWHCPPTVRTAFVQALEMKLLDDKLSWRQITEHVCRCAKSPHDSHCVGAIKAGVHDLRKVLNKYRRPR